MDLVLVVLALVANIWALWGILGSRLSRRARARWALTVVALPVVGAGLWAARGPKMRGARAT